MQLISPEKLRDHVGPGKRMSGRALARYVHVHPSTIDHLLSGRMKTCTPELAKDIETVLGVARGHIFLPRKTSVAIPKPAADNLSTRRSVP